MQSIQLDNELSIKKLDPENQKDIWLARQLDKDPLITGKSGYLWPIEALMKRSKTYLESPEIYGSPYAIYCEQNPIGYIELSHMHESIRYIDIAYALLNQERGKGYATKTIRAVTELILEDIVNDIKNVILTIDFKNTESQNVAMRAGFTPVLTCSDLEIITYVKTKNMLYQEQHRK